MDPGLERSRPGRGDAGAQAGPPRRATRARAGKPGAAHCRGHRLAPGGVGPGDGHERHHQRPRPIPEVTRPHGEVSADRLQPSDRGRGRAAAQEIGREHLRLGVAAGAAEDLPAPISGHPVAITTARETVCTVQVRCDATGYAVAPPTRAGRRRPLPPCCNDAGLLPGSSNHQTIVEV